MNIEPPTSVSERSQGDTFQDFSRVIDRAVYRPLPDNWWVGATDVVESTRAIVEGRYKAVNMAGASAISAVLNALGGASFPFAFGGDGAALAVPPKHADAVRDTLARTARWARDRLGLELRTALVPISDIRAADREVLVAYYAPSPAVRYAMFAGGGIEWAEDEMKAGRYAIPPAPPGELPDLSGLSCRWKPMASRSGVMLSVIVRRGSKADDGQFRAAVNAVLAELNESRGRGNPLPPEGPEFGNVLMGFDLEARASAPERVPALGRLKLLVWRVFAWVIVRSGIRIGGFQADHYRRQTALNSDFRKFHDGLNLTLDSTEAEADRIEALLADFQEKGIVRFGTFRQSDALMTCIVPAYSDDGHFHFVDGAGGGYAEAARRLKAAAS